MTAATRPDFGIGVCPPADHELGPGRVLVGWAPCNCPSALGSHKGHRTVQCLGCKDEGYTTIWYTPEHVGTGGHVGAADMGR
jgi:hypothetical protein